MMVEAARADEPLNANLRHFLCVRAKRVCIDHDCAGLRRATPRHLIAEIGHVLELG